MVLLLRNARETRGASRMAQLLVLAAGGSIAFNDDLDTGIMAGDLIVKTLTFVVLVGPSPPQLGCWHQPGGCLVPGQHVLR